MRLLNGQGTVGAVFNFFISHFIIPVLYSPPCTRQNACYVYLFCLFLSHRSRPRRDSFPEYAAEHRMNMMDISIWMATLFGVHLSLFFTVLETAYVSTPTTLESTVLHNLGAVSKDAHKQRTAAVCLFKCWQSITACSLLLCSPTKKRS